MKKLLILAFFLTGAIGIFSQEKTDTVFALVRTDNGVVKGIEKMGINIFRGIPYAQPPVGNLRWQAPQPVKSWTGVKNTYQFGPRAMQAPLYNDMRFRSNGMSEDCLYLNIWTPRQNEAKLLPVLVYFYGGGLTTGDGSEYRYDGESMARRGIVVVTVNYRVGVFGFFSHPELTKESPHKASGNYGFLDQNAALKWVHKNINTFGGDPNQIIIGGESAGGASVNAHMVSPLSKHLIAGAIGQSGSALGLKSTHTLSEAEKVGTEFSHKIGAQRLKDLRSLSADSLLKLTAKMDIVKQGLTIDGYFFTEKPEQTFQKGLQANIPLLIGWNSIEMPYQALLGNLPLTVENYTKSVQRQYPDIADDLLNVYSPRTDNEVLMVATELASDMFMGFNAWKWTNMHTQTSNKPVYRYLFSHPRPDCNKTINPDLNGAFHSVEIEYVLGNLPDYQKIHCFTPIDYTISNLAQTYFVNFIKTRNPNGDGTPRWTPVKSNEVSQIINFKENSTLEYEKNRERYLFLDKIIK